MTKVAEFGIEEKQKKLIYIIMVSIVLGMFFLLFYLIFILINTNSTLIVLSDGVAQIVGVFFATLGAVFGRPLGKKWWNMVYVERKKGAVLKVK